MEFIFLYDFLQNVAELYLGKFGSFQGCHEVEVGKIDAHEMHTRCGNHTVEKYLDEKERSHVGAYVFGIVDEIATHCCAGVVRLLFSV